MSQSSVLLCLLVVRPGPLFTIRCQLMQHDRQRYDEPVDGSHLHLPPSDGNSDPTIDPDLSTHEISDTFRYLRKGVISEGATGVVWLVFDNLLQREFAAKVLKTDFTDPDSLPILTEEVRAATRVNHPNVVRVYDMIWMGVWCIAMQYISGTPFDSWTRVWKAWSLFDLLGIAIQITDAVAAAHRAGVLHGDLSPNNVIIDEDGKPYIIDFGRSHGLLRTRAIVPLYAAPEGNVATVSTASDVYSLGILLHQLVTGQLPFSVDLVGNTPDSIHPKPSARPAVSRTLPRGLRRSSEGPGAGPRQALRLGGRTPRSPRLCTAECPSLTTSPVSASDRSITDHSRSQEGLVAPALGDIYALVWARLAAAIDSSSHCS